MAIIANQEQCKSYSNLHVIDLMEKEVVGVVMKEFNTVLKRK
jgi:hypothetical protein